MYPPRNYPDSPDLSTTQESDDRRLGQLEQVANWRLFCLTGAYLKARGEPCSLEDAEVLASIACSESDLHQAVEALTLGCSPQLAGSIFA